MRAPAFWDGEAGGRDAAPLLQALAAPLSWLYAGVTAAKIARAKPVAVAAPVICVGNVSVGGVGKTPVVRALRARLAGAHVLSRGHGGRLKGPLRVDAGLHGAGDVGDEPLLHAMDGPVWIGADRAASAREAIAAGARLLVMDDGFQNPGLAKDLSILVFDARAGIGNGRVVPAGPLREPLKAALARADAAVVIGAEARPAFLAGFGKPILFAAIEPIGAPPDGPLVAFAGIGRPDKLFETVRAAGGEIAEAVPFPDHHPYAPSDLAFLARLAEERGALLVTTEKDLVRLPPAFRAQVAALPVRARFTEEAALDALLAPLVAKAAGIG